jgi:hypothetical protein
VLALLFALPEPTLQLVFVSFVALDALLVWVPHLPVAHLVQQIITFINLNVLPPVQALFYKIKNIG